MIIIDSRPESGPTILGDLTKMFVVNNSLLKQIIISPATGSTTYDFNITDVNGKNVYEETNCSGEFNQIVELPIYGNVYVNIENSSVDENYGIILTFRKS
jgi:hypothetical protein